MTNHVGITNHVGRTDFTQFITLGDKPCHNILYNIHQKKKKKACILTSQCREIFLSQDLALDQMTLVFLYKGTEKKELKE